MSQIQAPNIQEIPSASPSSDEVASQLDLSKMSLSAPVYKYRRFYQVQGGASFTPTGSNYLSQFTIPGSSVWNFAKSYLTLDVTCPTSSAGNGRGVSFFTDCMPIDSIQLQTDNGTVLANIQNCQAYTKIAQALVTDEKTLSSRSPVYSDATVPCTAFPRNVCQGLNPFDGNSEIARTTARVTASVPTGVYAISDAAVSSSTPVLASGTDRLSVPGVQRLVTGVAVNASTASAGIRYRLNLKDIIGTVFAVDKDMFFGTNLQLQIYFRPADNFRFQSNPDLTNLATAGTVSVNNYYLYLAEDINEQITAPLKQQVMSSGASLYVPYTVSSQFTTDATAGYVSSNLPLVPGEGLQLKRILTSAILSSNTLLSTANTFNVNQVKFSSLQTFMDSKPVQDMELMAVNSDFYNYLYEKCKDSCAVLSERTYDENAFWLDDFSDADSTLKIPENDCKLSGLPVDMQKNYAIRLNKAAVGLILCHWKTYVRNLTIKPSGISWGQ
jgi:hypothetical protein